MFKWMEAFHIISVISWMAALLYLPRLYVYHANLDKKSDANLLFKKMERRLLFIICVPSMIASILFGFILTIISEVYSEPWLKIKFVFVLGLITLTYACHRHYQSFQQDKNTKSAMYFRILNESVTVFMAITVVFAVVKPYLW